MVKECTHRAVELSYKTVNEEIAIKRKLGTVPMKRSDGTVSWLKSQNHRPGYKTVNTARVRSLLFVSPHRDVEAHGSSYATSISVDPRRRPAEEWPKSS